MAGPVIDFTCITVCVHVFFFQIRDLELYLCDPVKRHLTISQIPALMRQQLIFSRRYVYALYEILEMLGGMGLLSFGKRGVKEKEQVMTWVYFHFFFLANE